MNRRLLLLIGIPLALAAIVGWWLWWRQIAIQAPACFARLEEAFVRHDAGGVLAVTHPDYDIKRHWPQLGEELGEGDARARMLQGLLFLFQSQQSDPILVHPHVYQVDETDDGQATVIATIVFATASGAPLPVAVGRIERHRFVLARSGWLGRMAIIDHAPFDSP